MLLFDKPVLENRARKKVTLARVTSKKAIISDNPTGAGLMTCDCSLLYFPSFI